MENFDFKNDTQIDTVSTETAQTFANQVAAFVPAKLIRYKNRWTIEYYVFDYMLNHMVRKQVRVEKIRKRYGKRANVVISRLMQKINKDLIDGNTPFAEYHIVKHYPIRECIDKYIQVKRTEIRDISVRNYTASLKKLLFFLTLKRQTDLSMNAFTKQHEFEFCEYISGTGISAQYYNEIITVVKSFWAWSIDRGFAINNPFSGTKKRKTEEKLRKKISPKDLAFIFNHLKKSNYRFYIFCLLVYSCLLRPQEILRCRISNFNLEDGTIWIDGTQTKNKNSRKIIIPNFALTEIKTFWEKEQIEQKNKDLYLFGGRELNSGFERKTTHIVSYLWGRLREVLNLPKEYQLYSLRDTGITDMLYSNITPKAVQIHADHHSLAMTEIYSHSLTNQGEQELRNFTPPKPQQ